MVIDSIKQLEAARAKVAELEEAIAEQLFVQLKALPAEFGFSSVEEFVEAVEAAAGGRAKKGKKGKLAKGAALKSGKKKRAKRAKITAETKEQVRKLVEEGKTGAAIAKTVGISLPSVQNIKKELGLVKSR